MKEWTIYFKDESSELTVFAESFEKWWHTESYTWYWKFSDGSMFLHELVRAIVNNSELTTHPHPGQAQEDKVE